MGKFSAEGQSNLGVCIALLKCGEGGGRGYA